MDQEICQSKKSDSIYHFKETHGGSIPCCIRAGAKDFGTEWSLEKCVIYL